MTASTSSGDAAPTADKKPRSGPRTVAVPSTLGPSTRPIDDENDRNDISRDDLNFARSNASSNSRETASISLPVSRSSRNTGGTPEATPIAMDNKKRESSYSSQRGVRGSSSIVNTAPWRMRGPPSAQPFKYASSGKTSFNKLENQYSANYHGVVTTNRTKKVAKGNKHRLAKLKMQLPTRSKKLHEQKSNSVPSPTQLPVTSKLGTTKKDGQLQQTREQKGKKKQRVGNSTSPSNSDKEDNTPDVIELNYDNGTLAKKDVAAGDEVKHDKNITNSEFDYGCAQKRLNKPTPTAEHPGGPKQNSRGETSDVSSGNDDDAIITLSTKHKRLSFHTIDSTVSPVASSSETRDFSTTRHSKGGESPTLPVHVDSTSEILKVVHFASDLVIMEIQSGSWSVREKRQRDQRSFYDGQKQRIPRESSLLSRASTSCHHSESFKSRLHGKQIESRMENNLRTSNNYHIASTRTSGNEAQNSGYSHESKNVHDGKPFLSRNNHGKLYRTSDTVFERGPVSENEASISSKSTDTMISAIDNFATQVYFPFLVASQKSLGSNGSPPKSHRVLISTLIAIREMLIMNAEYFFPVCGFRGFGEESLWGAGSLVALKKNEKSSLKRKRSELPDVQTFKVHAFANALIRSALKRLLHLPIGEQLYSDVLQTSKNYDLKSDDFKFCLERSDARSQCVQADGTQLGPEESTVMKVSFNHNRACHPLIINDNWTSEKLTIPSPTACVAIVVEKVSLNTMTALSEQRSVYLKASDDNEKMLVFQRARRRLRILERKNIRTHGSLSGENGSSEDSHYLSDFSL